MKEMRNGTGSHQNGTNGMVANGVASSKANKQGSKVSVTVIYLFMDMMLLDFVATCDHVDF